ncbi:hypothetical protein HW555_003757 [Spodoptera exigua]|uniref:BPTI/Kunitz inhibitor domain-containing protein n=1 Tax=Spodoptera exigua TaxID=7107 RepID=A0A835GPF7_SPOEX|nr:hypothetical protein HW555_003757 [Spodoptera exigua]
MYIFADDIAKLPPSMHCKFQPNRIQCGGSRTQLRYYWDIHGQSCKPFYYGNCKDSYNMFTSLPSCRDNCEDYAHVPTFKNLTEKIFCLLQPEFGNCNSYYPRWYFDINEMQCKGFSFSGCGGNHNRFDSFTDCAHACGDVVSHKNLTVSK